MAAEPKLLLNDNNAGKPEGIQLMIGRRPYDRLRQLDRRPADAGMDRCRCRRAAEDAGAARGGEENGWTVISMKKDWRRIFAFE
jgi:hypothetical protein